MNSIEYSLPLRVDSVVVFNVDGVITRGIISKGGRGVYINLGSNHGPDHIESLFVHMCDHSMIETYYILGIPIDKCECWISCTIEELTKVLEYMKSKCEPSLTIIEESVQNHLKEHYHGNEIKLQRTKAVIKRGTVPTGCRIRCKVNKTSISSKPLEYTAISR